MSRSNLIEFIDFMGIVGYSDEVERQSGTENAESGVQNWSPHCCVTAWITNKNAGKPQR